jgi:hypothetical protein
MNFYNTESFIIYKSFYTWLHILCCNVQNREENTTTLKILKNTLITS